MRIPQGGYPAKHLSDQVKGTNMNVYENQYRPRQSGDATIVVIPSTLEYVGQMERVHQLSYGYEPAEADSEDMTAEKYARHLEVFPEGQYMALDVETGTVVGATTSMRIAYDPQKPSMRSWSATTGDG